MHQHPLRQIIHKNTLPLEPIKSFTKIKHLKGKLPSNFFLPLKIQTGPNLTQPIQPINSPLHTPYFGSSSQPSEAIKNIKSQQFYSWFFKSIKPISSRVQTLTTEDRKRNFTQRKDRKVDTRREMRTVEARRFDNKNKIRNTQHVDIKIANIAEDITRKKLKYNGHQIQKDPNFNDFKLSYTKRGVAETKYKLQKALNSLSSTKQVINNFLPSI